MITTTDHDAGDESPAPTTKIQALEHGMRDYQAWLLAMGEPPDAIGASLLEVVPALRRLVDAGRQGGDYRDAYAIATELYVLLQQEA